LVPAYNINITYIGQIKAIFQAKKASKSTHLKGMKFFRLSSRLVRRKLLDMERSLLKNLIKDVHKEQLQSVFDLSLLRLARVKRSRDGSLWLRLLPKETTTLGVDPESCWLRRR